MIWQGLKLSLDVYGKRQYNKMKLKLFSQLLEEIFNVQITGIITLIKDIHNLNFPLQKIQFFQLLSAAHYLFPSQ